MVDTQTLPKAKQRRGFACMSLEKRREIAARGAAVPAAKRSFSTKPCLAADAGSKGGQASRGGRKPKAA